MDKTQGADKIVSVIGMTCESSPPTHSYCCTFSSGTKIHLGKHALEMTLKKNDQTMSEFDY